MKKERYKSNAIHLKSNKIATLKTVVLCNEVLCTVVVCVWVGQSKSNKCDRHAWFFVMKMVKENSQGVSSFNYFVANNADCSNLSCDFVEILGNIV